MSANMTTSQRLPGGRCATSATRLSTGLKVRHTCHPRPFAKSGTPATRSAIAAGQRHNERAGRVARMSGIPATWGRLKVRQICHLWINGWQVFRLSPTCARTRTHVKAKCGTPATRHPGDLR